MWHKQHNRQPVLHTRRLVLRPFVIADAKRVSRLAGDPLIADTTLNIPHPYHTEYAERWISGHRSDFAAGRAAVFALTLRSTHLLVGAVGLGIDPAQRRGELGYWVGKPYWNKGFCTEAGRAIVDYGLTRLNLNRIQANHFSRNPASGRVMQKLGMVHEGCARQYARKDDHYEDVERYAILKTG